VSEDDKIPSDAATSKAKTVLLDDFRERAIMNQEAQFRGWQSGSESLFPLYNVVKAGHPSYGSTVSETTLQALHIRIPRTPSPYPDVEPSPWHKSGVALESPATAREALEASGLDFTVVKKPLKDVVKSDYIADMSHRWATVRTDTGELLSIVDESYEPVQNRDAFSFFDDLVGSDEAIYETAGSVGKGERIWILAKLPGYIRVRGKDIVSKYLLLSNSHDGSSLVQMKVIPIRAVCNNTLTAALKGAGEINLTRTSGAREDREQSLSVLETSNAVCGQLGDIFNRMAVTRITAAQLLRYVNTLVPENDESPDNSRVEEFRNAILELHENGQGADLSRGTLWGAFNCVAEFTDHAMTNSPSSLPGSNWSGRGEQMNRKAFELAEQLM
jgi:phage/plasmid-like protein (TIGR03299 family)